MAIISSVQYNGGFLPDIILLTQCYYHWGTRLNAIRGFVFEAYDPPPKRFVIFSFLTGGCSEGFSLGRINASGIE